LQSIYYFFVKVFIEESRSRRERTYRIFLKSNYNACCDPRLEYSVDRLLQKVDYKIFGISIYHHLKDNQLLHTYTFHCQCIISTLFLSDNHYYHPTIGILVLTRSVNNRSCIRWRHRWWGGVPHYPQEYLSTPSEIGIEPNLSPLLLILLIDPFPIPGTQRHFFAASYPHFLNICSQHHHLSPLSTATHRLQRR
jgi:hypothetical protein